MYQGTQWMSLEGKRGGQLQMCSSLVTSKSNFSPMGSHCLTLPAAHQKRSQAQRKHSENKGDGSCGSKNLETSAPRCRARRGRTWQVLCLSKQLCHSCQAPRSRAQKRVQARLKETISAKGVTLCQGNVNLLCDGTYAAKTSPP